MLCLASQGNASNATLASSQFLNGTEVHSPEGTRMLYSYLWQLRGGDCMVNTGVGAHDGWEDIAVACNISLAAQVPIFRPTPAPC